MSAAPGAGGLTLLPYLDHERTPDLPDAAGTLGGLTRANMTPANVARAAVEGMLCGLADGLDAIRDAGTPVQRVLLIGGAARSRAVQAVARAIFGVPLEVPSPGEYVALGAARQASWVLSAAASSGADEPPEWPVGATTVSDGEPAGQSWATEVRQCYADLRQEVHGV